MAKQGSDETLFSSSGKTFGPPDQHGRRVSTDGTEMMSPGNDFKEFTRDGVQMVLLPDGKEMKYDDYVSGCLNGSIGCSNPLNFLI